MRIVKKELTLQDIDVNILKAIHKCLEEDFTLAETFQDVKNKYPSFSDLYISKAYSLCRKEWCKPDDMKVNINGFSLRLDPIEKIDAWYRQELQKLNARRREKLKSIREGKTVSFD